MHSRRFSDVVTDAQWSQLRSLVAEKMGLHFPRERAADFERGLSEAAREFGCDGVASCAQWLLSAPLSATQLEVLAGHLTIGETYFFRDSKTFDVLRSHVLPELIHGRRGSPRRLRLWSAACCTGEEAYSLAIVLRQVLPEIADWHVTILATDINPRFLRKAVAGVYSEWSFRNVPEGFKERYFNRIADGRYAVRPEVRQMVTFEHVNLVDDRYPALATDTNAMDVIFCRNVLMYFTPGQIARVVGHLHDALVEGGWLAVSPSEASQQVFSQFQTRNFPGVILYQRTDAPVRTPDFMPPPVPPAIAPALFEARSIQAPPPREPRPMAREQAASLYEHGRYAEASDLLLGSFAQQPPGRETFSLLARALANQGELDAGLTWCDRWIAADKLDAAAHYMRAAILLELARPDEARQSLQRAVYLDPTLVLAHFALGNLTRTERPDQARRHFLNAMQLLERLQPDDVLPESDGLTARRLMETITTMAAVEQAMPVKPRPT